MDRLPEACPYSFEEIEAYLFDCHYHWMTNEEPTTFKVTGSRAQKVVSERRYWLIEAFDGERQRQWFVVVGTGKSAGDPSRKMKRWMYAQTNDDNLSPDEFLDKAYEEQLAADARS